MKVSPEIEAKGLKAYEQVRAFERLRTWRLPLSYVIFILLPLGFGLGMRKIGHYAMADLNFLSAFIFLVISWFHWRWLCIRYVKNLRLLGELENTYGEQLPWVQVEKHFAALDRLKKELAEERGNDER